MVSITVVSERVFVMNKKRPKPDTRLPATFPEHSADGESGAERLRLQQLQAQANELRRAVEEHFARLNASADSAHRDG